VLVRHEDAIEIGRGQPLQGEAPFEFLDRKAAVHQQAGRADLDHEGVPATPAAK